MRKEEILAIKEPLSLHRKGLAVKLRSRLLALCSGCLIATGGIPSYTFFNTFGFPPVLGARALGIAATVLRGSRTINADLQHTAS